MQSTRKSRTDSGGRQLLNELEALRQALYPGGGNQQQKDFIRKEFGLGSASLNETLSRFPAANSGLRPEANAKTAKADGKPRQSKENPRAEKTPAEKKKLWDWKPLRALAHIGRQRLGCEFSLRVHSVEGLPIRFDGLNLCVHWRRREGGVKTKPARVFNGVAEFGETLYHKCTVYGNKAGPNQGMRYDSKFFEISVFALGVEELELCKHRVDLSRMLPETIGDLGLDEKSGSWTTNFKLTKKEARGGLLSVTIGYKILDKEIGGMGETSSNVNPSINRSVSSRPGQRSNPKPGWNAGTGVGNASGRKPMRSFNSFPNTAGRTAEKPRARATLSSSTSAPGVDIDSMSLLSLDDHWPIEGADGQQFEGTDMTSLLDFKPRLKFFSQSDEFGDAESGIAARDNEENEGSSGEESAEFSVVEKGVEMGNVQSGKNHKYRTDFQLDEAEESGQRVDDYQTDFRLDEVEEDGQRIEDDRRLGEGEEVCKLGEGEVEEDGQTVDEDRRLGEGEEVCRLGEGEEKGTGFREVGGKEIEEPGEGEEDGRGFREGGGKEIEKPSVTGQSEEGIDVSSVGETETLNSHLEATGCERTLELEYAKEDDNLPEACSLDDMADSVAGEFLSKLGVDHSPFALSSDSDPDSPRARLLKQFEREGGIGLGIGIAEQFDGEPSHYSELQRHDVPARPNWDSDEDLELASIVQAAESELQKATQTMRSKTRAKMLEDAETEALMQEWGMDERAFQNSPPGSSCGFGSPVEFPFEGAVELPAVAEGFGPLVKTRDGGFLRSMNPDLFRNSKSKGSLVMQISNPVVVPAEMGSTVMDILHCLASVGIEKLTVEARKTMPLEDITGKSIRQVALEAVPALEAAGSRQPTLQGRHIEKGSDCGSTQLADSRRMDVSEYRSAKQVGTSKSKMSCSANYAEYVSLEELAPLAMDKIEALSIEGLKVQSDMADQDAPSNVNAMSWGEVAAFEGTRAVKSGTLGLEGTAGLQLLDTKESSVDIDGVLGTAITLDEWMRLDAGIVDEEETSERTAKILAAHHALRSDLVVGGTFEGDKGDKSRRKYGTGRWGFMGNMLTIALLVQLRDPLRNFEPVGAPMMALIQAERVVVPPRPKMGRRVSDKGNSEEVDETEPEDNKKEEVSQFTITQVHVAGLISEEEDKKTSWSNPKQQQSGSRWLIASGMGKSAKHPILKSKQGAKPMPPSKTKVKTGDTLWSISSRAFGDGGRWKEIASLNPHIRNPNIILPNDTLKLR